MSKPPFVALPPGAEAFRLGTSRGDFAAHRAGRPARGTALLLPGFTGSKEDFIALLEPLADAGYRVVAVDGRGQYETAAADGDGGGDGEGGGGEAAYAQRELALDARAQAEALGGGVHLLGHSLGGHVARAAVLRDARPFVSLTLMSSGPAAVAEPQQARVKLLSDALKTLDMESVWQAMRAFDPPEAADARTPADVQEFLHRRWLTTDRAQLLATGRQLTTEPDRTPELAAVPLPVHVLSGEADYAWPIPLLDAMARRLSARRTVVQGAEHSPAVDRPAETARALADFWSATGAGAAAFSDLNRG